MPKPPETLLLDRIPTPIGEGLIVTDEAGLLRAFDWTDHEDRMRLLLRRQNPPVRLRDGRAPDRTRHAFEAYFAGEIGAVDRLETRTGGTEFQRRCWAALRSIPAGQTRSYKDQAMKIGAPAAVRAVGLANGQNPIGVVAPCHRVIGANGALTGYGGGLDRKRWLLAHEGAV